MRHQRWPHVDPFWVLIHANYTLDELAALMAWAEALEAAEIRVHGWSRRVD